jgi:tetratricopeptide (TPR) repeat protein
MIKKTSHSQSIEQYRFGPMSESERLKFEQDLVENPKLNHEFQLDIEIDESLKQYDIIDLRRKLFRAMNEEKAQVKIPAQKSFHSRWYMVAASITFLILLGGAFHLMKPVKYTNNTLFEMYYSGENAHNLTRSAGNNNDEAMTKYKEGDYNGALVLFNEILDKDAENIYIRYYTGLASIETNQNERAIKEFKYIIDQKNNLFVENAQWYLALSYLKNNQVKEAKTLLVRINDSSNPHNKEASQILKRISE